MLDQVSQMNGIIAVVNTPFTADNKIDIESLRRYVQLALKNRVVGFLVPAMAAEVDKLTIEERETMVRTVLEAANGTAPVIGGASAADQKTRLMLSENLIKIHCDAILVCIPFENEDQYCRDVRQIAELKPNCLVIQEWDFRGYGVPVPVIAKLFRELEVFRCLKVEVVPAGAKYSAVIQATGGKLHVSGGWAASQMIEGLDRGVNAFMATILHDIYGKVYELHRSGERKRAQALFYHLLPILSFSHQHPDICIHFNKRMMHRLGIFSTFKVREPILPFDSYHQRVADELMEKALRLSASLKAT